MRFLPTAVQLEQPAWVAAGLTVGQRMDTAAGQFVAQILLNAGSEYVVVVEVEHVHSVSDGQGLVAPHDHEVVVVTVGRLVSEVVAAGDDGAVVGVAGVDDDDLVVDDGVPGTEQLGAEIAERPWSGQ